MNQSNTSAEHISQAHQSNTSAEHINQAHQSSTSIKHINQTHQSSTSIKHISQSHPSNTSAEQPISASCKAKEQQEKPPCLSMSVIAPTAQFTKHGCDHTSMERSSSDGSDGCANRNNGW
jgi:hypothetical protein